MTRLQRLLALTDEGDDHFLAPCVPTTRPRTFGGQVAAQALGAAARTVPEGFGVHSLHAYFLREADPSAPIELEVSRIREGRSFCTRQVCASQSGRAVFVMLASFHVGDAGPERVNVRAAAAPHPDELPDVEPFNGFATNWPDWDIRRVPAHDGPTAQLWLRYREPLGDDPLLQSLALTYLTDLTLLGVAITGQPHDEVQMASLDHAVWFHHPARTDQWLLFDQASPCAGEGRALTEGRLYDLSGRLVASVVQEGLMRFLR